MRAMCLAGLEAREMKRARMLNVRSFSLLFSSQRNRFSLSLIRNHLHYSNLRCCRTHPDGVLMLRGRCAGRHAHHTNRGCLVRHEARTGPQRDRCSRTGERSRRGKLARFLRQPPRRDALGKTLAKIRRHLCISCSSSCPWRLRQEARATRAPTILAEAAASWLQGRPRPDVAGAAIVRHRCRRHHRRQEVSHLQRWAEGEQQRLPVRCRIELSTSPPQQYERNV